MFQFSYKHQKTARKGLSSRMERLTRKTHEKPCLSGRAESNRLKI
nr:MAG TPA: hypothetical protein [Caudoviricetes sp.]